jgi:predicted transcriptional regulator
MVKKAGPMARGELEALVMGVLWDHEDALTPGDVHDLIRRQHPVAYTTVMTILVRLWHKGLTERQRKGRAFAYQPVFTRDEWAAGRMQEFLAEAGDRSAALTHFVSSMNGKELGQLRKILDRRRR